MNNVARLAVERAMLGRGVLLACILVISACTRESTTQVTTAVPSDSEAQDGPPRRSEASKIRTDVLLAGQADTSGDITLAFRSPIPVGAGVTIDPHMANRGEVSARLVLEIRGPGGTRTVEHAYDPTTTVCYEDDDTRPCETISLGGSFELDQELYATPGTYELVVRSDVHGTGRATLVVLSKHDWSEHQAEVGAKIDAANRPTGALRPWKPLECERVVPTGEAAELDALPPTDAVSVELPERARSAGPLVAGGVAWVLERDGVPQLYRQASATEPPIRISRAGERVGVWSATADGVHYQGDSGKRRRTVFVATDSKRRSITEAPVNDDAWSAVLRGELVEAGFAGYFAPEPSERWIAARATKSSGPHLIVYDRRTRSAIGSKGIRLGAVVRDLDPTNPKFGASSSGQEGKVRFVAGDAVEGVLECVSPPFEYSNDAVMAVSEAAVAYQLPLEGGGFEVFVVSDDGAPQRRLRVDEGQATLRSLGEGRFLFVARARGRFRLAVLDAQSGAITRVGHEFESGPTDRLMDLRVSPDGSGVVMGRWHVALR